MIGKSHSFSGQLIQVRRDDVWIATAADGLDGLIVAEQKYDIGARRANLGVCGC